MDKPRKIIEIKPDFTQRQGQDKITLQDLDQKFNNPYSAEDRAVTAVKSMMRGSVRSTILHKLK